MLTCENCGLPQDDYEGFTIKITIQPEGRFQRVHKKSVWVHNEECRFQTLGIVKYGAATFRWPISLEEFRRRQKSEDKRKGIKTV